MSEEDDELGELVPKACSGDRRALGRIIQIIHPRVLRYARARIGGGKTPTAEDVAQEICLAVSTSIASYVDRGKPFMAFVYGIASNKVADAHRSLSRDRSHPTEEVPDSVDQQATPEEASITLDGSNRVRELLDTLGERAREILILRVFVGLSADETAQIIGSTPGAVRVAQHRALASLRSRVEEDHSVTRERKGVES